MRQVAEVIAGIVAGVLIAFIILSLLHVGESIADALARIADALEAAHGGTL